MKTTSAYGTAIKSRPSIFVVEDNEDIGFILELFLHEEGFEVKVLPTAAEFTLAVKLKLPDLILLDVMLPDGNGMELCNQLKVNTRSRQLPVLIMSAHAKDSEISECDADEFIPKPFDLNVLLQKIRVYLPAA